MLIFRPMLGDYGGLVSMRLHSDWSTAGFQLAPAAKGVGPFPRREFLSTWWEHCAPPETQLLLAESATALLPLCRGPRGITFVGHEDLTDYHVPLGSSLADLLTWTVGQLGTGTFLRLDSMPEEVADSMAAGLEAAGCDYQRVVHEVAMVVELPASFDAYAASLEKKHRHELERKRRRFQTRLGAPILVETADLESFVRLHRLSRGRKGSFMTPETEAFFTALARHPQARIHLLEAAGRAVAAAFGFLDADGYYLYNSAYDPGDGEASPGVVLVAELISRMIAAGVTRFDFLKGEETYKHHLGALPRPLYRLEATT